MVLCGLVPASAASGSLVGIELAGAATPEGYAEPFRTPPPRPP